MTESINRQRLEFATVCFLTEMRRQHVKLHPERENPVPLIEDYSPEHLAALFAGLQKAILVAGPSGDAPFAAWIARKAERESDPLAT